MVAFIVSPIADETLHSLLARTMRLQGCRFSLPFIRSFLGEHVTSVNPLMTTGISEFIARSCWDNMDAAKAVERWTPLAYFRPFASRKAAETMQRMLVVRHKRGGHRGVGVRRGDTHWHTVLNFCPNCRDDDIESEALPAWRRTHQLPGVFVCPDHAVPLQATSVPSLGSVKLICCPLPDEDPGQVIRHEVEDELALQIACASRWLLENPQHPRPSTIIQGAFRHLMAEKGFIGVNGMAKPDFADALANWMETTGAAKLLSNPASNSQTSMQRLWGRTKRMEAPTLAAILLMNFLQVSPRIFFEVCDIKPGLTGLRSRRSAPHVRASTISRHRSTITALVRRMRGASRTQLRRTAPTAWCFLLAHDRDWLETAAPARRRSKTQYNWRQLDAELVQRAHQVRLMLLAKPGMPQRLTFARIAGAMGYRTKLFCQGAKLPRTMDAIRSAAETTESLIRRRMEWVISGSAHKSPRTWSEFTAMVGIWRLPTTEKLRNEAADIFSRRFAVN